MDVPTFLANYPEFAPLQDTDPLTLSAALARAERRTSDSWGAMRDDIVALHAADSLARSPFGRNAALVAKDGTTSYATELEQRKKGHAFGRSRAVAE